MLLHNFCLNIQDFPNTPYKLIYFKLTHRSNKQVYAKLAIHRTEQDLPNITTKCYSLLEQDREKENICLWRAEAHF